MSLSAAVAYRWDGRRSRLFFQMKPDSYDTASLIDFLKDLRHEFPRDRVILVWDNLSSHKSAPMREYLGTQRRWLRVARLPGYAPELNPVESMWGNLKGGELANRCVSELGEMTRAARKGIRRIRRRSGLLFGFLRHAGLPL